MYISKTIIPTNMVEGKRKSSSRRKADTEPSEGSEAYKMIEAPDICIMLSFCSTSLGLIKQSPGPPGLQWALYTQIMKSPVVLYKRTMISCEQVRVLLGGYVQYDMVTAAFYRCSLLTPHEDFFTQKQSYDQKLTCEMFCNDVFNQFHPSIVPVPHDLLRRSRWPRRNFQSKTNL